jgi:hypothetical protein
MFAVGKDYRNLRGNQRKTLRQKDGSAINHNNCAYRTPAPDRISIFR